MSALASHQDSGKKEYWDGSDAVITPSSSALFAIRFRTITGIKDKSSSPQHKTI
jgi:hypothetical protein